MKNVIVSERIIVEKAKEIFEAQGFRVALEVPFLERSIDLVYMDEGDNLIAIEFKWNNWRRALAQASSHVYGASKVYICIPKPQQLSEKLLNEIKHTPIGLLFFTFDMDTKTLSLEPFIQAKKTKKQWAPGRKWLKNAFQQRERGETKCCIA